MFDDISDKDFEKLFSSYMHSIISNTSDNYYHKYVKKHLGNEPLENHIETLKDKNNYFDYNLTEKDIEYIHEFVNNTKLSKFLKNLLFREKQFVFYKYFKNLSYEDISLKLNCSIRSIKRIAKNIHIKNKFK